MNIVITGASRGIGFETAKLLAADSKNKVLAISRNEKKLLQLIALCNTINKEHQVIPFVYDIVKDDATLFITKVIRDLKQIDVLINNAGYLVNESFDNLSLNDWHKVYDVNVFGTVKMIQASLQLFNKKFRSHIVNISSMGGLHGTVKFNGLSAYSSAKGAICTLTECLAEEFKQKNIAVNCLAIGAVQTEMLSEAFPGYKAPLEAREMAEFVMQFAATGQKYFNGKIIPVSLSTP